MRGNEACMCPAGVRTRPWSGARTVAVRAPAQNTEHRGAMDPAAARDIAYASHGAQRTRSGECLVEHLERVAAAVPAHARAVAFLHDVLEHTDRSGAELGA